MARWFLQLAIGLAACAAARRRLLDVKVSDDASFAIHVQGQPWLESAALRFFAQGTWQTLEHAGVRRYRGSDELGAFSCVNASWRVAGSEQLALHTSVKLYADDGFLVFVQQLPKGAEHTNASNPGLPVGLDQGAYPPIVAFPAFLTDAGELPRLGYTTWEGGRIRIRYGVNAPAHMSGLTASGPVALFDGSLLTLVVSPMDHFTTAVQTSHGDLSVGGAWEMGVSSEITALPPGFTHRTVVLVRQGVTAALDAWGRLMQKAHGTQRRAADTDRLVNHLSYWTDNGAFYYGDAWHEAGGGGKTCNEESMVSVARGLEEQDLLRAVRTWQMDDWWYPGHHTAFVHCVQNWTLLPPAFEHNLGDLSRILETPLVLYVPFFCPENVYQTRFEFVVGDGQFAVPHPDNALDLFRELFAYGVRNGMVNFEHDFVNFNHLSVPLFRRSLGAYDKWLAAIDTAAVEQGLPVQLCMALPGDLMASLHLSAVTNFRGSKDYARASNYDIGGSSLLGFALGLRPSKDSFWTQRPSSGDLPHYPDKNPGTNCELNTIIATLSTGPVGIADKAGNTNKTLVLRSVRPDGLILQPDKPATYIDLMLLQHAPLLVGLRAPPPGHVWTTYSDVAVSQRSSATRQLWYYVLSIDLQEPWHLTAADPYPALDATSRWLARRWHKGHAPSTCKDGAPAVASDCVLGPHRLRAGQMPVLLNDRPAAFEHDTHAYDLHQLSPIGDHGWVVLGETARYVSMSSKRIVQVTYEPSGVKVLLSGVAGETVSITALRPQSRCPLSPNVIKEWTTIVRSITFEADGVAEIPFF
mmetsp:Transcript_70058/g.180567  ORF Transcript_70058/g.180567 Transcript_70058/m.180567 type:complete len:808 (-) Transcript_70058:158-2581(-)